MAITLTTNGASASNPMLEPVNPAAGIPQSPASPITWEPDPTLEETRVRLQEEREYLEKVRQGKLDKIYNAALDPKTAFKGKNIPAGFDAEKIHTKAINSAFLETMLGRKVDKQSDSTERAMARQEAAIRFFGGKGKESEEDFFQQIRESAGKVESRASILRRLSEYGAKSGLIRSAQDAEGINRYSFDEWKKSASTAPGYDPALAAEYYQAFLKSRRDTEETLKTLPQLSGLWKSFKGEGNVYGEIWKAYQSLPSQEERDRLKAAVHAMATSLPKEQEQAFWNNFTKQTGRELASIVGTIADTNFIDAFLQMGLGEDTSKERKQKDDFERRFKDFKADILTIRDQNYDPVKYLAPDDSLAQAIEQGAYASIGAVASTMVAAVPYIGQAAFYSIAYEGAYQSYRQQFEQWGMPYEQSSEMAQTLALPGAALELLAERFQVKALAGRLPIFEEAMRKVQAKMSSTLARGGARIVGTAIEEGMLEKGQDLIYPALQEFAHALGADVPDQQWLNGKDGILDGFWNDSAGMIVTMLPLAIIGGARGAIGDKRRVREFREASDTRLLALGAHPEDIRAFRDANGIGAQATALERLIAGLDPQSETAKDAVETLMLQLEALRNMKSNAQLPRAVRDETGWTLIDQDTNEPIATGLDTNAAMAVVGDTYSGMAPGEKIWDRMMTIMQATDTVFEKTRESDPESKQKLQVDIERAATEASLAAEGADIDAFLEEVSMHEQANGGDGQTIYRALGDSSTEVKQGIRHYSQRIFRGGSVLTVFHELWHNMRKRAIAQGRLSREEQIQMLRMADKVLGERMQAQAGKKNAELPGQRLTFLEPNVADADLTERMIDEGMAELGEIVTLLTRKKVADPKGFASILMRNILSFTSGKPSTIRTLLDVAKGVMGLSLTRAAILKKAQRDGKLDLAQIESRFNEMTGLSEQEAHNQAAQEAAQEIQQGDSFAVAGVHNALKASTTPLRNKEVSALRGVPETTKSHLVGKAFENLDRIFKVLGNPLESPKKWATFVRAIANNLEKDIDMLIHPERAMQYREGEGIEFVTNDLLKHPEFVQSREAGLAIGTKMLTKFRSGELGRQDLAGLFVWGLLSRGVGAYYQEGGYLTLHRLGLLERIENVFAGKMTPEQLSDWAMANLTGPGKSTTQNVMKIGDQIKALATEIDGRMAIDTLLEAWKSDMTGPELRREVFRLFTNDRPSIQIQNKVLSFIILVSGRPDVLVLDRIQFRHLWGGKEIDKVISKIARQVKRAKKVTAKKYGKDSEQARLAQEISSDPDNIYDNLPEFDEDGAFKFANRKGSVIIKTNGIAPVGNGLHGLAIYEALEQGISESVRKAYVSKGISYPGVGAFHWDSWLVTSQQAISHPTLAVVAKTGISQDVGVQQGKFTQIDYGVIYRYDGRYMRELLTTPGEFAIFDQSAAKTHYTKSVIDKAIGKNIQLGKDDQGNERKRPWTEELTAEQKRKFDEHLLTFGQRVAPARGTVDDAAADGRGRSGSRERTDAAIRAIERQTGFTISHRSGDGDTQTAETDRGSIRLTPEDFTRIAGANKASNKFGSSVDVYSPEDYSGYELIVVRDGEHAATASVSPTGEVGAVTKSQGGNPALVSAAFSAALETGKVRWLNGFDTVLPVIYAKLGFAPIARTPFDPQYQPPGWDYETYKKFNDGKPDVVFMRYTGTPVEYRPGDGVVVGSFDEGVEMVGGDKPASETPSYAVTPEQDAQYLDAVERGDMETAQRMVEKAAKSAGYTIGPVVHGGREKPDGRFPKDTMAYFSNSDGIAAEFASYGDGTIINAYLRMENPKHVDLAKLEDIWSEVSENDRKWLSEKDLADPMGYLDNTQIDERAILDGEHDGVIVEDSRHGEETIYVVKNPSQIKSADTVVRDKADNVIPLSKRFNTQDDRISYSVGRSEPKWTSATHFTANKFESFSHEKAAEARRAARNTYEEKTKEGIQPGYTTPYGKSFVFPGKAHFFFIEDAPNKSPVGKPISVQINLDNALDLTQRIPGDIAGQIIDFVKAEVNAPPSPGHWGYTAKGGKLGGFRNARKNGITAQQLWDFLNDNTFTTRAKMWDAMLEAIGKDAVIFHGNSSGTFIGEEYRGQGDGKTYTIAAVVDESKIRITPERDTSYSVRAVNGFYSKLERVLGEKMPKSATPEQVLQIAAGGAKAEEVKWTGLADKVKEMSAANNGKVDRDQLMGWLANEGAVRLEEVTLGIGTPFGKKVKEVLEFEDWDHGTNYTVIYEDESYIQDIFEATSKEDAPRAALERYMEEPESYLSEDSKNTPRYGQYTLPGGKNYREVVLSMPVRKVDKLATMTRKEMAAWYQDQVGYDITQDETLSDDEIREIVRSYESEVGTQNLVGEPVSSGYVSRHFPAVQNYVAHMRLNDREDANGKPGLLVEELQSDLHQKGRESGYLGEKKRRTLEELSLEELRAILKFNDPNGEWDDDIRDYGPLTKEEALEVIQGWQDDDPEFDLSRFFIEKTNTDGVPDAPHRKDWYLALFKRALRDAVASGKDWIGWTTGATQVERFNLSKHIDKLVLFPDMTLRAYDNGVEVIDQKVTRENLSDYIGKEAAARLLESPVVNEAPSEYSESEPHQKLEGEQLEIGGEGMVGFYDQMLVKEIGKYVKQWGAKVEKSKVRHLVTFEDTTGMGQNTGYGSTPIWRVGITPAMRQGVGSGQASFSVSRQVIPEVERSRFAAAIKAIDAAYAAGDYALAESLDADLEIEIERMDTQAEGMDEADQAENERDEAEAFDGEEQISDPTTQLLQMKIDFESGRIDTTDYSTGKTKPFGEWIKEQRVIAGKAIVESVTPQQIEAAAQELYDIYKSRRQRAGASFSITPETESAYMDAATRGNTKEAGRMVDETIDMMGLHKIRMHGDYVLDVPEFGQIRAYRQDYSDMRRNTEWREVKTMRDILCEGAACAGKKHYMRRADLGKRQPPVVIKNPAIRFIEGYTFDAADVASEAKHLASLGYDSIIAIESAAAVRGFSWEYDHGTQDHEDTSGKEVFERIEVNMATRELWRPDEIRDTIENILSRIDWDNPAIQVISWADMTAEPIEHDEDGDIRTLSERFDGQSFSLAPAAMIDKLETSVSRRIKDPVGRMQTFDRMIEKLHKLRDLVDTRGVAFNFDAFGKPYGKPITNEAEGILNALAIYDGILSVLPVEVRGRIGGYVHLAKLTTNEERLAFLRRKLTSMDKHLEKYLKKEYGAMWKKLLEREKVKKNGPGKKPKGKAGADIHDLFATLREFQTKSLDEAQAYADAIMVQISKGDLTPDEEAHKNIEAQLVVLVADWKNATAERRADLVRNAQHAYDEGYYRARLEKLLQAEDRKIMRDALILSTGRDGMDPLARDEQMIKEMGLKGKWRNVALSLGSFEQTVNFIFGENSKEGRRLVDMEREASYQYIDTTQAIYDKVTDLFTKLAGGGYAGEVLRYEMSQKTVTIRPAGKSTPRKMSQFEMITATLQWRQEDGKRHMRGHKNDTGEYEGAWHYDQDFIDEIESKLSDEAKAVRTFLIEQYGQEWAEINPLFRELNGVNLPKVDFYSPMTVTPQQAQSGQVTDPVTGFSTSAKSTTPGSLRTRGQAIAEPDFRDAMQVFLAHKKQIEHWKAYAKFSQEASSILNNRQMGNAIKESAGSESLTILRKWIDYFAEGGYRDAAAQMAFNQQVSRWVGRGASIALVGRAGVLAIQSTQLGAAMAEMPTASYVKRMGMLMTGNLGWGKAFQSEFIQRRLAEMPVMVRAAIEGLRSAKPSRVNYHVQQLGSLIGGADALFTAGTYAIVYDYQLMLAKKEGLTGPDAEAFAARAAERSVERIAQPTRAGTRSYLEVTAVNPIWKLSWAFASEARQKLALSAFTLANPDASLARKGRALAVTWVIGGLVASLIRNAWRDMRDDDDDEVFDEKNWGWKRLALSSVTGPLGGIPVIGDMAEAGLYAMAGEYLPEGNMLSAVGRTPKAMTRIPEWFTGERDLEEAIRDAEVILSGMGVFNDTIAAYASLSHLARDLFQVTKNFTEN